MKNKIYTLLRKSEKYTKTDMIYAAKGGFWLSFGTAASGVISLITSVAFANLLPKHEYGTYQYILGIIGMLSISTMAGINTSTTRSVAKGHDGSIWDALRCKALFSLAGSLVSLTGSLYYYTNDNTTLGSSLMIVAILLSAYELPGIYVNYLAGKKRFDLSNKLEVASHLFAAILIVASLLYTDNIIIIIGTYLIGWTIARIVAFIFTMKIEVPNKHKDPSLIPFGKHLTYMTAINTASANLDKILIWHTLGATPVAIYTLAQAIPTRMGGFIKIVNRLAFPKLATADYDKLKETLPKKIYILIIPSALLAITYSIFATTIFEFFFPKYTEAVNYSRLASILILLQPFSLLTSALTAQAQKTSLYKYNIGMPIIRIFCFSILIPTLGIIGAFTSLITIKIVEVLFLFKLFKKSSQIA